MLDDRVLFPGKVGLQQRVLPDYRAAFFDHLSETCEGGVSVFAGLPRKDEAIQVVESLKKATYTPAKNHHFMRGQSYLCIQGGLKNWLEGLDPDVLILEANPRYISNRRAVRWMRLRRRPVIGWGLGISQEQGVLSGLRLRIRMRYLSGFDALIAYSSRGAEQFAEIGIPPERIHVAVNSATPPPKEFPSRGPKTDDKLRVIFVGRLQTRKRVDLLLRVCALLEPKPECWIVGDGPERASLEMLAQEVFPEATFFGVKHDQELGELFAMSDLFVLPGTGGLAIQEAMSSGLPVIVAEGDGTQRDLVTGGNGWLIKPNSLEELNQAMRKALSDPDRLRHMGEASYKIVVERANIEAMAEVFRNVMNSLIKGSR